MSDSTSSPTPQGVGTVGPVKRGPVTAGRKAQQGRKLMQSVQAAREEAPPDPFRGTVGRAPFPIKAPIIHAICPL